jgi:hypothetical protein
MRDIEEYLRIRWKITHRHGNRLMSSAELYQKIEHKTLTKKDSFLSAIADILPTNESQVRPLLRGLKSDSERVKVWIDVTLEGKAITAELVQTKVNEFIASGEIVEEMEFDEIDTRMDNDVHVGKNSGENEWYTPECFIEGRCNCFQFQ